MHNTEDPEFRRQASIDILIMPLAVNTLKDAKQVTCHHICRMLVWSRLRSVERHVFSPSADAAERLSAPCQAIFMHSHPSADICLVGDRRKTGCILRCTNTHAWYFAGKATHKEDAYTLHGAYMSGALARRLPLPHVAENHQAHALLGMAADAPAGILQRLSVCL